MHEHTPPCIVRDPMPPAIPRRLPARLQWWERLWCQVAADATASLGELRANGWADEPAREALTDYAAWITGNIEHAVALAMFADELETA